MDASGGHSLQNEKRIGVREEVHSWWEGGENMDKQECGYMKLSSICEINEKLLRIANHKKAANS